jgi:hypothetical protein
MKPAPSVGEFLAGYPADVLDTAERIRAGVRASVPDLIEAVYPGWRLIGYRVGDARKSRFFGYVQPFRDRAVLGFEHGVRMADPHGVLEGEGSRVRFVVFRAPGDVDEELVRQYALEAAVIATGRMP